MPAYQDAPRLLAALSSLARQDYPPERVQVVVVDDGSPAPLPPPDLVAAAAPLRLRLVRLATNQGRARARNAGLAHAEGELVVFLDSDMTVAPGFLSAHAAAVGSGTWRVAIGHILIPAAQQRGAVARYQRGRGVHRLPPGEPIPFKCFVTGNSSLPRRLLDQVGGFDERFCAYGGEDLELGYRLHRAGAHFVFVQTAVSWHHHIRNLRGLCRMMQAYGTHGLPLLLALHPELAGVVRLDFLQLAHWQPRRLLLRAACWGVIYWPVWLAAVTFQRGWVPSRVLDYLWWRARTVAFLGAAQRSALLLDPHPTNTAQPDRQGPLPADAPGLRAGAPRPGAP
jgi:cellulose synthase/poly-beta-1,6-N-acetylglucosamine synthase-like glycosyltransferase